MLRYFPRSLRRRRSRIWVYRIQPDSPRTLTSIFPKIINSIKFWFVKFLNIFRPCFQIPIFVFFLLLYYTRGVFPVVIQTFIFQTRTPIFYCKLFSEWFLNIFLKMLMYLNQNSELLKCLMIIILENGSYKNINYI